MNIYLRNWVDDWVLNHEAAAPWKLPPAEAAAYVATTAPGSLTTADAVVEWLARGPDWAAPIVYRTSVAGWHTATADPARVTGRTYARSGVTLAALDLVPAPAPGSLTQLDILCDAVEQATGESTGVLLPARGSGLRIFWVHGLAAMCPAGAVPPGLHLRAMLESGSLAAEATALRLLTRGQVSMDEVRVALTDAAGEG